MHPVLIRFLSEKRDVFGLRGVLLTLGRQKVLLSPAQFQRWFGRMVLGAEVSDVALFEALGATTVHSLDYTGTLNATIACDLNHPLQSETLAGKYDVVLDGGTLEHCFNVGVYMETVVRLLRVGGRVLHTSPCQGYANHGFYNFQPTFFFDFYGANGFDDMRCFIFEHLDENYYSENCQVQITPVSALETGFASRNNTLVIFSARKAREARAISFPLQSVYRQRTLA